MGGLKRGYRYAHVTYVPSFRLHGSEQLALLFPLGAQPSFPRQKRGRGNDITPCLSASSQGHLFLHCCPWSWGLLGVALMTSCLNPVALAESRVWLPAAAAKMHLREGSFFRLCSRPEKQTPSSPPPRRAFPRAFLWWGKKGGT